MIMDMKKTHGTPMKILDRKIKGTSFVCKNMGKEQKHKHYGTFENCFQIYMFKQIHNVDTK